MAKNRSDRMAAELAMTLLGGMGKSRAHSFIMDVARLGGVKPDAVDLHARGVVSVYVPPRETDRVVLFEDGSGAYVHADGLVTPMGDDIRHEVVQWRHLSGPGPG